MGGRGGGGGSGTCELCGQCESITVRSRGATIDKDGFVDIFVEYMRSEKIIYIYIHILIIIIIIVIINNNNNNNYYYFIIVS